MKATLIDLNRMTVNQSSPWIQGIIGLLFAGLGALFFVLIAAGAMDAVQKGGVAVSVPPLLKYGWMAFCVLFVFLGLALAGYRSGTTLDREAGRAWEWESCYVSFGSRARGLRHFTSVCLESEIREGARDKTNRPSYYRIYLVKLMEPGGGVLLLGETSREGASRDTASQVALFLSLEFIDTTTNDKPLPGRGASVTVDLPVVGSVSYVQDIPRIEQKPYEFRECSEQPEGSEVQVENSPTGITLTLPPAGIYRGSKGLLVSGLVFTAFLSVGYVIMLGFMQLAGHYNGYVIAGVSVLWLLGPLMLAAAFHMGRRRAAFAVVGDSLMVLQTGPLGNKRKDWSREAITDIRTGPSNTSVGGKIIIELQVHPRNEHKVGFLAGRDEEELRWLATVLRRALHVSEGSDTPNPSP
jgi:hypothetical protein